MCLGIPARVTELRPEHRALVELEGLALEIRTDLVPEAQVGQYVIVHAGYAIESLDPVEAEETLDLLRQAGLVESDDAAGARGGDAT